MKIKIKHIGQLRNFSYETFHKKINIVESENGTGKTTFSRLLNSCTNSETWKVLNDYCSEDHWSELTMGIEKYELRFQKWTPTPKNIYVFNTDYYKQTIITKLGDEVLFGDHNNNIVRSFVECWKIMHVINMASNENDFFYTICSSHKILSLLNFKLYNKIFSWYLPLAKRFDIPLQNVESFIKEAYYEFQYLNKHPRTHFHSVKLINFINNAVRRFPKKFHSLHLGDYEKIMYRSNNNRVPTSRLTSWVFWKLAFIYCLHVKLDDLYTMLPSTIREKYDILANLNDQKMLYEISQNINPAKIAEDTLNDLINDIGLGQKFMIKDNHLFSKRENAAIANISSAENRLISMCYFFATINEHLDVSKEGYIIIDDPLTSMDINYSLNLVRVLSNLFKNSNYENLKWIILTHNAQFCDEMLFRLNRDEMRNQVSFSLWYLDINGQTQVRYYHHQFDTLIKRTVQDILIMSQNSVDYTLVDVCNKVRILMEIYCSVYAGSNNFNLLFNDVKRFNLTDREHFKNVIDLLNRYSHGTVDFTLSQERQVNNVNKILTFAIKMIKEFSPEMWTNL